MRNRLFNTSFEMSLRILMLTSRFPVLFFSSGRILSIDFICCYAKEFRVGSGNLHGDNNYMYGEIAGRKYLVESAIKYLVTRGNLMAREEKGFQFQITKKGLKMVKQLHSSYATQYMENASRAIKKYEGKSDDQLIAEIHEYSLKALKG